MSVYNKRGILLLPKVIVLNPKDGKKGFSITYPQLINKLWIMWVKIYTVHTGTSIHNFFPVFLKKSLD